VTVAVVTGSGGLIGAQAAKLFAERGLDVIGIDNDMRREFFGADASTAWQTSLLQRLIPNFN
jgi:CDP-paratose 2-epimerase